MLVETKNLRIDMVSPALYIAHGRIDMTTAPELEEALSYCYVDRSVCVDLSDVYYISSAGLRVLLQATKRNRNVYLYNPSEVVMDILDITGFLDIFTVKNGANIVV